jgi:hypothetical protein
MDPPSFLGDETGAICPVHVPDEAVQEGATRYNQDGRKQHGAYGGSDTGSPGLRDTDLHGRSVAQRQHKKKRRRSVPFTCPKQRGTPGSGGDHRA